jgi:hypothetical protein
VIESNSIISLKKGQIFPEIITGFILVFLGASIHFLGRNKHRDFGLKARISWF